MPSQRHDNGALSSSQRCCVDTPTDSNSRSSGSVVRKSTPKRSSDPGRHGDSSAAIVAMLGATIARPVERWKRVSDKTSTRRRCSSRASARTTSPAEGLTTSRASAARVCLGGADRCLFVGRHAAATSIGHGGLGPELLTLERVERIDEGFLQRGARAAEGSESIAAAFADLHRRRHSHTIAARRGQRDVGTQPEPTGAPGSTVA